MFQHLKRFKKDIDAQLDYNDIAFLVEGHTLRAGEPSRQQEGAVASPRTTADRDMMPNAEYDHVRSLRRHVQTLEKTLQSIVDEEEFFCMYDALVEFNSGFVNNRCQLLAAWKRGNELFTLQIKETDELFKDHDLRLQLATFSNPKDPETAWLSLPIFCWRDAGDACVMIWTAPHVRKLGLARDLLRQLNITRAHYGISYILPDSRPFWEHLAIPEVAIIDPQSGEPL